MTLRIDGVSKTLSTFAIKNVSLEVGKGEYFVLLGPTGAGKTLLLELIMGFHHPDKGKIVLNGQDVTRVPTEKRGLGYVPQNCPLFPHMSVYENVEFGLRMQRKGLEERRKSVQIALELVGLRGMEERKPELLSGGERQKIVLARVLATEPKVILLDEPLASIDAEASRSLKQELKHINKDLGVAVVHVTHDQSEAFSLARKMAIMREGQIVQEGSPREILSSPVNEFVARFLGYENIYHVTPLKYQKETTEVSANGTVIRLAGRLESQTATIAIRPEDVVIADKALDIEEWNVLEGNVSECMDFGPAVEVTVNAGLIVKIFIHKRSFLESSLFEGKPVKLGFRIDSVKVVSMG